ncbi:hypothetical protein BCON_0661g00020 [Botryotinia convoluta]|uniref:Uncharacterized protein n=1 Tax=Botryotinia convoluta TaxID=54673 RepID=A0A4Z1H960_9HELO|nr:hypothetical protein BCON_0661g00020 [Botryotinia convoluta]
MTVGRRPVQRRPPIPRPHRGVGTSFQQAFRLVEPPAGRSAVEEELAIRVEHVYVSGPATVDACQGLVNDAVNFAVRFFLDSVPTMLYPIVPELLSR